MSQESWDSSRHVLTQLKAVADPGQEPGGPAASLLIFRPNSGPKGRKTIFGDRAPRLSQGLDDPGPPPYLKVWIRQCQRHFEFHEDEQIKHLHIQLAWFLVVVKVVWDGGGVKKPRIQGFYELFYIRIPFSPALLRRLVSTCIKFITVSISFVNHSYLYHRNSSTGFSYLS